VVEPYDLLVGADGVGSAVRGALQDYYPDMTVVISDSGREYKTYRNLRGDIEPEGEETGGGSRWSRKEESCGELLPCMSNARVVLRPSVPNDVCCCGCCANLSVAEFKQNPGATLHLWTTDKDAWTTLTAHSNPDGTYR
jgi:hypothetical protein